MNRQFARHSLKQRIFLVMLATFASISTFTLMVLAPLAANSGFA
jgi:hypothetical protein